MKHITGVDCPRKNYLVIHYWDDADPEWVDGRKLVLYMRAHPNVRRLCNVTSNIFELLATRPEAVTANEEVLQEWVGKLFQEGLSEKPGIPDIPGLAEEKA